MRIETPNGTAVLKKIGPLRYCVADYVVIRHSFRHCGWIIENAVGVTPVFKTKADAATFIMNGL